MLQILVVLFLLPQLILHSGCNSINGTLMCNHMEKLLNDLSMKMQYPGDLPANPASSCQQVYDLRSDAKSGYYWIQDGCCPVKVYCVMNNSVCGGGVWTKIANVNMSIPSNVCPSGLEKVSTPKSCRKNSDSGCSTTTFKTYNLQYKNICGKIIGYQVNSPDAFYPYHGIDNADAIKRHQASVTPDDGYADGVLLTYSTPREHIWTFAAQPHRNHKNDKNGCPCLHDFKRFAGKVPLFVGQDFFCETGNYNAFTEAKAYTANKLWDGTGCGTFPGGCEGSRDPWFQKKFRFSIKSDLEMRVCLNQPRNNEDLLIEQIYLYIQ